MSCRLHGLGCSTPWGYDPDHTDQGHPYTPEQLAERQEGPHFYAYPTREAYFEGWHLWRAYRRDDRLNAEEAAVRWALIEERILGALPADLAAAVKGELQTPPAR